MRNKLSKSMMVEILLEAGCATTKPMESIELGGGDRKGGDTRDKVNNDRGTEYS